MTNIKQTANEKTYTVSSRELIYKSACNDVDLNPYRDADMWYEGADRAEALRIAREYAADGRDTGKVEVGELTGGAMGNNTLSDPDELACLRYCATVSLNHLLYVLSAENGAETVYAPPKVSKGQKVGKRTNTETVRMLGAKVGRAIGAARRTGYASSHGTGERTVAPHVRRAHWQSFWVGRRKGREDGKFGDELVVKWIPPIPVNQEAGEVTETVHLDSHERGE